MYKIFNIKESKCNFCNYKIKKCVINFTLISVVSILHLLPDLCMRLSCLTNRQKTELSQLHLFSCTKFIQLHTLDTWQV